MLVIDGADVQATIAHHVLGGDAVMRQLGSITLRPHQLEGTRRALALLESYGGALIADDVGLGKTYTALAVARRFAAPLVVAPAALRDVWLASANAAEAAVEFVSVEALSRGWATSKAHDLVIVDEAQHLRNASTKRFAACRVLCAAAPTLLLSATPVQNSDADIRVLCSLFLGERAHALEPDALALVVVRRDSEQAGAGTELPAALAPEWLHPTEDADCLDRIVALPPAVPPADGGDGGALLTWTLVRQWASSRAALRAALVRRMARARAMEDALSAGRMPTRRELAAWTLVDTTQQMAFPFMATSHAPSAQLLDHVRVHMDSVRELLAWIDSRPDPDVARAYRLRELMTRHPGRRILAFSEYADTVTALYRLLAPTHRVAMLTHTGGRVAAGRATRRELLDAFGVGGRSRMHERDRVDLLLTTDVLSEGVNLQDASVVIHLDLPWNPARMAQRVGRVRRIGAAERTVMSFAMAPPAPAERMLDIERRLRDKMSTAARMVGVVGSIVPGLSVGSSESATSATERIASSIAAWRREGFDARTGPVCGAVRATRNGAVACVRLNGAPRLLAFDGTVSDDSATVHTLLEAASSLSIPVLMPAVDAAVLAFQAWLDAERTTAAIDFPTRRVARARRAILRRVDLIARRTPRHDRAGIGAALDEARRVATVPLPSGAENALSHGSDNGLADVAWLASVASMAAPRRASADDAILAILLLHEHREASPTTPIAP